MSSKCGCASCTAGGTPAERPHPAHDTLHDGPRFPADQLCQCSRGTVHERPVWRLEPRGDERVLCATRGEARRALPTAARPSTTLLASATCLRADGRVLRVARRAGACLRRTLPSASSVPSSHSIACTRERSTGCCWTSRVHTEQGRTTQTHGPMPRAIDLRLWPDDACRPVQPAPGVGHCSTSMAECAASVIGWAIRLGHSRSSTSGQGTCTTCRLRRNPNP